MHRAFILLLVYQMLLGSVVYFAWPQEARLDANAEAARRLVDLFFLGQYILASLMAPSFASATITGEKERKTYEMLLASPLQPSAIVLGKLMASLAHLGILIFASLPIVMLCLPLGGVSIYEVLRGLRRLGGFRSHVRHDQHCLQQLFQTHGGGTCRLVFVDPAIGDAGDPVLASTGGSSRCKTLRHIRVATD